MINNFILKFNLFKYLLKFSIVFVWLIQLNHFNKLMIKSINIGFANQFILKCKSNHFFYIQKFMITKLSCFKISRDIWLILTSIITISYWSILKFQTMQILFIIYLLEILHFSHCMWMLIRTAFNRSTMVYDHSN